MKLLRRFGLPALSLLLLAGVTLGAAPSAPVDAASIAPFWQRDLTLEQQQTTYYYYVGPWIWDTTDPAQPFWRAPAGTVGLIDLRSLPQMGKPGPTTEGYGFFATTTQSTGNGFLVATGTAASFDSGTLTLSSQVKNGIRTRLGLTDTIAASDLMNLIWELLTKHADPTGQARWKPLMPDHTGRMRLYLGGHSLVKDEAYTPARFPQVLEQVRLDYAAIRAADKAAGSDQYRRVLDALADKYKVPWQSIAPAGSESPLPHQTTITESFDTANSDTLGPDLSWTELAGDIDIATNRADVAATIAVARAESGLSSDDHYSQAIIANNGGDHGLMIRKDDTTTMTYYWVGHRATDTPDTWRTWKRVATVSTAIGTNTSQDLVLNDVLKISADGSTVARYRNGVEQDATTDTAITANLYTGLHSNSTAGFYDSFEAGDLVGVVAPTVTTQAATVIGSSTATGNGNITDTGGENCTARGFEWDVDSGAPYANDVHEHGDFGTGAYTLSLTSLPAGTTIYYRAYATNTGGTGYGDELSFLTKPAAPTNVAASDGTSTSNVTVTWTKPTGADNFTVFRDGADISGWIGDVATYTDTGATSGNITAGAASATDGSGTTQVTLSVAGEAANNGPSHTYIVQAKNATGDSDNSSSDTGYRGVGALTYQWMRSAADSDADYSNIDGATTDPYNDTGGVVDPDGRYYKAALAATGATSVNTTADRGYMGLGPPAPPTDFIFTRTGTNSGTLSWTMGAQADNVTIVSSANATPTSPTADFFLVTSNMTSANVTGLALEIETYYWSAWSESEYGFSETYASTSAGGEGMQGITDIADLMTLLWPLPVLGTVVLGGYLLRASLLIIAAGFGTVIFGFTLWGDVTWLSIILVLAGIVVAAIGIKRA